MVAQMPAISIEQDTCFFHQTADVTSAETSSTTTNPQWLSRELMVSIAIMLFQLPFYSKTTLCL